MASLNSSVVHGSLAVTNEIHGKLDGTVIGSVITDANKAIPAMLNKEVFATSEVFVVPSSGSNVPSANYNWHISAIAYKATAATTYRLTQTATGSGSSGGTIVFERAGYSSNGTAWSFSAWVSITDTNTDTKVTQTAKTDNVNYPLLAASSASPTSGAASTAVYDTGVTLNPSTNTISANISGSATTLGTARTIQTNLGSTSSASFDGSANITPGVTGTLPVANGGTGATTAANARTNLGAASATDVSSIKKLIPAEATEANKLADKNYVDNACTKLEAHYLTADAAGNPFATHAALTAATKYYYQGAEATPDTNDIVTVTADEDHKNGSGVACVTRYRWNGSSWAFEYVINNSGLTTAQSNALNSGITSTKVSSYDTHIGSKSNPHGVTYSQVGAAAASHTHTKSDITDFAHTHSLLQAVTLNNTNDVNNLFTDQALGVVSTYAWEASNQPSNLPRDVSGKSGMLVAYHTAGSNYGVQEVTVGSLNTCVYRRHLVNGTWDAWKKVYYEATSTYSSTGTQSVNGTAVAAAINSLDVSDTAVPNKFVTAVSETDGKISVSRASLTATNIAQAGTLSNSTTGNAATATTATSATTASNYASGGTIESAINSKVSKITFTQPAEYKCFVVIEDITQWYGKTDAGALSKGYQMIGQLNYWRASGGYENLDTMFIKFHLNYKWDLNNAFCCEIESTEPTARCRPCIVKDEADSSNVKYYFGLSMPSAWNSSFEFIGRTRDLSFSNLTWIHGRSATNMAFPDTLTILKDCSPISWDVATAEKLTTARKLKTNLGSTTDATFDGSADQTSIPVTGTLPLTSGGTGATTADGARTNLGLGSLATKSSLAASDIPSLDAGKITTGTFADARIASASTWNAKQSALPTTGTASTTYAINVSGSAASCTGNAATASAAKSGSALETAINDKVTANTAITGATKTKITYDSKGLVTAGADATLNDMAAVVSKTYTGLLASSNTNGSGADFMPVTFKITDTNKHFKISYRLTATYTATDNKGLNRMSSFGYVTGYSGGWQCYSCFNTFQDTSRRPFYFLVGYRPKTRTNDWYLGVNMYNCNYNTTAGNERTLTFEITDCENCTVAIRDSVANTDYATYYGNCDQRWTTDMYNNGLRESGDDNSTSNVMAYDIAAWCSTAAGTAAKAASFARFELRPGVVIRMYNYYANTAKSALTLNIDGKGAKPIYTLTANNTWTATSATSYTMNAGAYECYYNGTNWYIMLTNGRSGTNTEQAALYSQAAYATKNVFVSGYKLVAGATFKMYVDTANTSATALNLNVNLTGAKPMFINGTLTSTSAYTLAAGWYYVYYDGTNYHVNNTAGMTFWRPISVNGTDKMSNYAGTKLNFKNGTNTTVEYEADGNIKINASVGSHTHYSDLRQITKNLATDAYTDTTEFVTSNAGGYSDSDKQVYSRSALLLWNYINEKLSGTSVNIGGSSASCTGNAATASEWATARNFTIKDADQTNSGTAVAVKGNENETLLLPSTIKATLTGNASSATYATALSFPGDRITNANVNDNSRFKVLQVTSAMSTGKPVSDGWIMHFNWDSNMYASQISVPNNTKAENKKFQFRQRYNKAPDADGAWEAWGAMPMDITGNAGSASAAKSGSALETAINGKVTANTAITGATKCKITYDSKGLVTSGADLAASDIPNLNASKITAGTFADERIASAATWNAKQSALPTTGTASTTYAINVSGSAASATSAGKLSSVSLAANGKIAIANFTDNAANGTIGYSGHVSTWSDDPNGELLIIGTSTSSRVPTLRFQQGDASDTAKRVYGTLKPSTLTANRDWSLPDVGGTIALTSSNVASATTASYVRLGTIASALYVSGDTHHMCLGSFKVGGGYENATLLIGSAFWGNQHGSQDIITIHQDNNTNSTKTVQCTLGRVWLGGSFERKFYYIKDDTNLTVTLYVYVTGGNSYGIWTIAALGGNVNFTVDGTKNVTKLNTWTEIEYSGKINAAASATTATDYAATGGIATALAGKQGTLATQTAYSAKGSATQVPKITTNSLGQVTKIEEVTITGNNYYPTAFAWTAGTTAGPTGSLTGTGMSAVSFGAIPSASATASGIVTTGAQTFAGVKTHNAHIVVNPGAISHFREGIRLNQATDGYAIAVFGGAANSESGTGDGVWLVGRRGSAGSTKGGVGDFTIENNGSNGTGLTIFKAGGAYIHGAFEANNQVKGETLNVNSKVTMQYNTTNSALDFVFA